ncbi:MAG: hypothetical protein LCI00_20270 [Chloroflexi bacterium]|nr:hypothetical protein [Chloroflexota bacterium]MCC6893747.1 hypothetical protein [Anaerolineae bacterium]
MLQNKHLIPTVIAFLTLLLAACDPLASQPTPAVIIITAVPSATPPPTATQQATQTPIPTLTPVALPSPTAPPCDEPAGQVLRIDQFASAVSGENLRYRVYVPPCYQKSAKRYPVVILLHGSGQKEDEWENLGVVTDADQGFNANVLPPMIIVMPYFGTIGNNPFFPPDPSYETVVLDELVPAIDRDFCTWSNRDHRAIGGISRGGFWAYSIGMRHPDVFGILGGHSAYMSQDLNEIPPDFNPLEIAANSETLADSKLRMYIDNGAQDPSGFDLELFSTRMSERGIPHTYVINPVGNHDEDYWSAHVSEYLAFYGRAWPRAASALPDCADPSP